MNQRVDAIYENGAFYPEVPLWIPSGSKVVLDITTKHDTADDDLSDIQDLLDLEYTEWCRQNRVAAPSVEEARKILSKFKGSLADYISEDRDER